MKGIQPSKMRRMSSQHQIQKGAVKTRHSERQRWANKCCSLCLFFHWKHDTFSWYCGHVKNAFNLKNTYPNKLTIHTQNALDLLRTPSKKLLVGRKKAYQSSQVDLHVLHCSTLWTRSSLYANLRWQQHKVAVLLLFCRSCTMYSLLKKSCGCVCECVCVGVVCVYCRERSKGPLVTSLVGIGTSGGPAAPLVNMLLLSGPQRHTPRYNMHTHANT